VKKIKTEDEESWGRPEQRTRRSLGGMRNCMAKAREKRLGKMDRGNSDEKFLIERKEEQAILSRYPASRRGKMPRDR